MGRGKKPTPNTSYQLFIQSVESHGDKHRTVVPIPGSCPFVIAAHPIKAFPPVDDQGKKFRIPGFCSAVRPDRLVFRVPGADDDNSSYLVDLRQLRATVRTLLTLPQADQPSVLEAVQVAYRCMCRHFGGVGTANEAEFEQEYLAQAFFGLYLDAAGEDASAAADKWREQRGQGIAENEDRALEKARARHVVHVHTGSNPSISAPQGPTIVTDITRDEAEHNTTEGGDAGRRGAALIRQPAASGLPSSAEATPPLPVPEDPVLKTGDWALDSEKDSYLMDFAEAPPPPLLLAGSGPKRLLPPLVGRPFRGKEDLEAQGIFVERKRRPRCGNNN